MDEQEFQNIKDWVDEFKIAIVDYPNAPNLSWIVEYVPLLIAALESCQAECKRLTKRDQLLSLLERGGVDNWSGWDECHSERMVILDG